MSLHPSYISPKLDFSEPPKPPKPGKVFGILSIVCGAVTIFTIAFPFLLDGLIVPGAMSTSDNILIDIIFILFLCSPLFAIIGIIFGFLGRKTEGKRYANIGLVLNTLLVVGIMGFINFIAMYGILASIGIRLF